VALPCVRQAEGSVDNALPSNFLANHMSFSPILFLLHSHWTIIAVVFPILKAWRSHLYAWFTLKRPVIFMAKTGSCGCQKFKIKIPLSGPYRGINGFLKKIVWVVQ